MGGDLWGPVTFYDITREDFLDPSRDEYDIVESPWAYVMVNFMCQLDWVMGCQDTWLTVILGVSVRMFLDEFNI